jgi:hypothetical protein
VQPRPGICEQGPRETIVVPQKKNTQKKKSPKKRASKQKAKSASKGELKTKAHGADPIAFIDNVSNETRRKDAHELVALMKKITGKPPKMWGPTIVGFDQYHYKYASGREGVMPLTGFSPRTGSLVLYLGPGLDNAELMTKLGKHNNTKGCLYINKLDDVDRDVLRALVTTSVARMRELYPA